MVEAAPVPASVSASCRPSANAVLAAARSGWPPSIASIAATACLRALAADDGEMFMPDRPRLAPGGITLGALPLLCRKVAADDTEIAPSVSFTPNTSSSRPPQPPPMMFDVAGLRLQRLVRVREEVARRQQARAGTAARVSGRSSAPVLSTIASLPGL